MSGRRASFRQAKGRSVHAGLHFHLWPIEQVEIVKVTEQQQNVGSRATSNNPGAGLMLSGDQNIVSVQFSVLFTVSDPQAYLFNLEEPVADPQQLPKAHA